MILRTLIGIGVGGALGFAYYKLIGCASGMCPLTSNPWTSTASGMLFGALLSADARRSKMKKDKHETQEKHQDN
jgi:hypothetical protein